MDKIDYDNDLDEGLELKDEITAILLKSVKDRISGKIETISLEEAFNLCCGSQKKHI